MTTALIADPICKDHEPGWDHPESPRRYEAIWQGLEKAGLLDQLQHHKPRAVSDQELAMCHAPEYIDLVQREIEMGHDQLSTGDTHLCPASLKAARYAVGTVFGGIDAVMNGSARNAFCLARPPGHHATYAAGMGFCLFNNVALGARYAQQQYGLQRVLIVDWDVHHGNGTQDIFYTDPTVFFFSAHQAPSYPFTGWPHEIGEGAGQGTTLNVCYPANSGREEISAAIRGPLNEAMQVWHPDLILISAGFDAREHDPLGHGNLQDEDFARLTREIMNLAHQHGRHDRVISVLEGGYNLNGLASAATEHVRALMEYKP